jgi:ubiquinone/menaquinone biosynthesis C-methylase UbiE
VSVVLVCPLCKGALREGSGLLVCMVCESEYGFEQDVPVLISGALSDQHEHQRRYFDAEFAGYESYALENWRLSFIERIFLATGVLDGADPYLDAGVGGSGGTVIEAARRGVEAVGCDLSIEGVVTASRFAREQDVAERARFVACAAEALPFPDSSFGSASGVAILEHLDDDAVAVAELARVLRPGGLIWLMVPHAFRHMPLPVWPFYWWHDRRIGHKRHYDEERLVELCSSVGLEHVRTIYSGHAVKILQYLGTNALPAMREPRSPTWWRLEGFDRRAEHRRRGAMHLNALFRRPKTPRGYRGRSDAGA